MLVDCACHIVHVCIGLGEKPCMWCENVKSIVQNISRTKGNTWLCGRCYS